MADIVYDNISDLISKVIPAERTLESKGDLAFHPVIVEEYKANKFELAPRTKAEAAIVKSPFYNQMAVSIPKMHVYIDERGNLTISVDLAPARYYFSKAQQSVITRLVLSYDEIGAMSPMMANASVILPGYYKGEKYALGQIKGDVLGKGQAHPAFVAGGLKPVDLASDAAFLAALNREAPEETGVDLSTLVPSSFRFLMDERELGFVNAISIAEARDLEEVIHNFNVNTKEKLRTIKDLVDCKDYIDKVRLLGETLKLGSAPSTEILDKMVEMNKIEVAALAALPVQALALFPLEEGMQNFINVKCFIPTLESEELEPIPMSKKLRPFGVGLRKYLASDQKKLFGFMEDARF